MLIYILVSIHFISLVNLINTNTSIIIKKKLKIVNINLKVD